MVILFNILSLLFLAIYVFIGIQNIDVIVTLTLTPSLMVQWPLSLVVLLSMFLGVFLATGFFIRVLDDIGKQKQRLARSAEKLEVSAETSGEKVKALEAKIQTLEKALDDALTRR